MSIGGKYIVFVFFLALIALFFLSYTPSQEFVSIPENTTFDEIENETLTLMSPVDDSPATQQVEEKPGWWKHTGDSTVSYSSTDSQDKKKADIVSMIDLEITVNGEDADSIPGPNLSASSQVELKYIITNMASHSFYNLSVSDDFFGDVGNFAFLDSGESISFKKPHTVKEGQFEMLGDVTAQAVNNSEIFNDQDMLCYLGINSSDGSGDPDDTEGSEDLKDPEDSANIPEFPNIIIPLLSIFAILFVVGRK